MRSTLQLLSIVFILTSESCQSVDQQRKTPTFIKEVTQLHEFKLAQKQVDSLKKASGIPVEVSIEVIDSSFVSVPKVRQLRIREI
jgi:hypothetical protein